MEQATLPATYKYKIDAEVFVKLFLADDHKFEELKKEFKVEGIERLTLDEIKQKKILDVQMDYLYSDDQKLTVLYEAQIEGDVVIKDQEKININPLYAYKSKFNNIKIENSKIGDKNIPFISFLNCYTGVFYIRSSTTGSFSIRSSNTEVFSISSSNTGVFSIHSSITGSFYIRSSTTGNFSIRSSTTGVFSIRSSTTGVFSIHSSITGSFFISTSSTGDFYIFDNSIRGNFILQNCQTGRFKATGLYVSFKISASNIPLFELKDCFIPKFRIDLANKIEIYLTSGQINLLDFSKTTLSKDSIISITGSKVYTLLMEEFGMLGNLYFRQIIKAEKCFEWYKYDENKLQPKQRYDELENRYKKECTELVQKYNKSTIHISQSSLGKTEFSDCPLEDFEFQFNNSNITSCFITAGTIPDDIKIIDSKGELVGTGAGMYNQKASFFNQLKRVFEAGGDVYRTTQFQAKWAKQQSKYLRRKFVDQFKDIWKLNRWFSAPLKMLKITIKATSQDMYAFIFNKLSNNHGESWLRALGFTVITTMFFYILYLSSIGRCFNGTEFDTKLIGSYFEFLNPLHKTDFIDGNITTTVWSPIVDFFGRIFVGVGTYKFLAAFKKHSKQ
ncbi:MAG: hypothetical protein V1773_00175 [bacterium]